MFSTVLSFLGGFITKEFLISMFKEVVLELILDMVDEFVADSENTYDDKLAEKFREFVDNRD